MTETSRQIKETLTDKNEILDRIKESSKPFQDVEIRGVNFDGQKFDYNVDFSSAIFTEGTSFRDAEFQKEAHFANAKFSGKTDFISTQFANIANFDHAQFTDKTARTSFCSAKFFGMAWFSNCQFDNWTDFSRAQFTDKNEFIETLFDKAKFFGGVNFAYVQFANKVNFRATHFKKSGFVDARFYNEANFRETQFIGGTTFLDARFYEYTDFKNAQFIGYADFEKTTFEKQVIFEGGELERNGKREVITVFHRESETQFSNTYFAQPERVLFIQVFLGKTKLIDTNIKLISFTNVEWAKAGNIDWPNRFKKAFCYKKRQVIYNELIARKENKDYALVEEVYRQLKVNFEQKGNYDGASDFHWGEMEMRRLQYSGWLRRNVFFSVAWYKYLSGYGERHMWVLLWLIAVIFLPPCLYLLTGMKNVSDLYSFKYTLTGSRKRY